MPSFLLIEKNGDTTGYARLHRGAASGELEKENAIEGCRIYILKKAIGMGLGKQLMQACLQRAQNLGASWIWLGVWEQNSRALAFYKKWGFEKFGEHIFMLGDDPQTDWLMKKKRPCRATGIRFDPVIFYNYI